MQLTCEELDPIDAVRRDQLEEILSSDAFGKFAILSESESAFIQAGSDWQPTDECSEFLKTHDSDPWIIEFRDSETGAHHRAVGYVTLKDVIGAFTSYLDGGGSWRNDFEWKPVSA